MSSEAQNFSNTSYSLQIHTFKQANKFISSIIQQIFMEHLLDVLLFWTLGLSSKQRR